MRTFLHSIVIALFATVSTASFAQAGDACPPHCVVKKIRTHDANGNLVIKKVEVCR